MVGVDFWQAYIKSEGVCAAGYIDELCHALFGSTAPDIGIQDNAVVPADMASDDDEDRQHHAQQEAGVLLGADSKHFTGSKVTNTM